MTPVRSVSSWTAEAGMIQGGMHLRGPRAQLSQLSIRPFRVCIAVLRQRSLAFLREPLQLSLRC
jgi:hypothetical protein